MENGGIEPMFDGVWPQLEGCLDFPCDLTPDPTLAAVAESDEAQNLVRRWVETAGSELVRP